MPTLNAFMLHIEPATASTPARVSIALTAPENRGTLRITPDCMSLDEFDTCIGALHDELELLNAEARAIFGGGAGYA